MASRAGLQGGRWLVAAAVSAGALLAWFGAPRVPAPLGRGSPAPAFELPRLGDGAPLALADLRGQVVLINFWATWCKPCEDEMPAMERLYRRLQPRGLELLAISVDERSADVGAFQARFGVSFPILLDPDKAVASRYQTARFPETLLVGTDGVIVERYVGPKDWDAPEYADRILRLLEG